MLGFLFGVVVGALGFWAYKFWKGEDDTTWDQSFSTSSTDSNSFGSYPSEPISSGTPGEATKAP